MSSILLLLIYSTLIFCVKCAPLTQEKGMNYLKNFGYTSNKTMGEMTSAEMKEAIEKFQKVAHIPMTGVLDEETKKMMQIPRCRMADVLTFVYSGRWNNSHLTYKFVNYPINNDYNESVVVELVTKAMKLWIDHVDLVIERIYEGEPDINIRFVDIEHSSLKSSQGLVLASALPPADGDMYYLDEDWDSIELGGYPIDLHQIAAHEFGHSLGLNHLDDINSVMYPFFMYKDNFVLNSTDIQFVEVLYNKKYSLCDDGNIDAVFSTSYTIYIFRGFQVWRYFYGYLETGYPKLLSEEFPGLKSSVNATFFYEDHIYFIQGVEVSKYNNKTNMEKFAILEQEYDAAVTIDDRLYTFKGSQYWRYDINETGMSMVRTDYPRDISRLWKGVPGDIDAVYYDGDAHFFKGTTYYKFDTDALVKDAVEAPIGEWEGCKNN